MKHPKKISGEMNSIEPYYPKGNIPLETMPHTCSRVRLLGSEEALHDIPLLRDATHGGGDNS
jgi:hypothetical protein